MRPRSRVTRIGRPGTIPIKPLVVSRFFGFSDLEFKVALADFLPPVRMSIDL
jgi:hypothetical protein